ncbi:uncharacterized protein Socs36E isoform X1 [Drosophila kikkawai]|uniref:Uncharacterized protein Socs36E isoform X1 n=1 Tax=Drosophila kikkawai TaxID=30033 RepID=A0A6P4IXG3_DROKI|nr:uncharacterized protein LOC108082743 isoform X1 [Drosophila kikkawai]
MGHHFSKPIVRANSQDQRHSPKAAPAAIVEAIGLDEEELQVEEFLSEDTAASQSEVRQIIIKIQLAKMEQPVEEHQQSEENQVAATLSADALNANGQQRIVNVTLERGAGEGATEEVGVVGSSAEAPKNNNFAGSVGAAISTLQLHDANSNNCHEEQHIAAVGDGESREGADINNDYDDDDDDVVDESLLRRRRSNSHQHNDNEAEAVEYCEVLESLPVSNMLSSATQHTSKQGSRNTNNSNSCCRSRSSKTLSMGAAASSSSSAAAGSAATSSKRRCCKCKCRDAFRGLRDMLPTSGGNSSSSSSAHNKKESSAAPVATVSRKSRTADRRSTPPTLGASSGATQHRLQSQRKRNSVAVPDASHQHHQVIIRITSPGFVVESPGGGRVTVITEPAPLTPLTPPQTRPLTMASVSSVGPRNLTVHSQIDFMHCLVPDLEKITNSSFYWGKMDRYEAEHLLEGKPEGTFLLRDSAQEEFLFSVTFRKYGRSLHARIEQSGHKFSFDCHDPCVFTAPTVTGLLEHYKDPACVMFFEPCLTIPLHRRQTFSLQQLARATIVSNTSYDGINQLELPGRLKSYLKEYHYKQKLRVKPIDQNTPVPYYGDV